MVALKGTRFKSVEAVKAKATEILNQLTEADFQHCSRWKQLPAQWKSRMELCGDRQREYIEGEKVAIVIVTNTMMDPVPGWIDTFNGPAGNTVASGKGVLRTMYADPDLIADYIPCDIVVKGSIIATWKKGNENNKDKYKLTVCNGGASKTWHATMAESNTYVGRYFGIHLSMVCFGTRTSL
ncbi:hypothetical protein NQ318_002181 [Aromia moschata]|uniref:Fatty acyl-CoA reductase n=1 Tax=Aromia moschata TaxID=1265417 RepID=A0AAV8Z2M7_9CUCU|nr:hypothetical protein NQ318_002181 [Aromia moschata]